jgi:hypothetical protein
MRRTEVEQIMQSRLLAWPAGFVVLLFALTGCASSAGDRETITSEQVLDDLAARIEMVDAIYLSQSVIGSLPNVPYLLADGSVVTESDSVVVGEVISVGDVRGYILKGETVQPVEEGDAAMWHLARVTFSVEESWGTDHEPEIAVTFPLSSSRDLESSIRSLQELGRVLLILDGDRIVHNEEYLGLVDERGGISYPLIGDPAASEGVTTLDELRAALSATRAPVRADLLGTDE